MSLQVKVKEMLKKYPLIEKGMMNFEDHRELGGELSIFTAPLMVLFIEGKEVLRESKHVNMGDIDQRIERYYEMFF